jgi:uncharacterized protein (TIGR02147 family)
MYKIIYLWNFSGFWLIFMPSMRPTIYTYLDYRHYLADLFSSLKEEDASFSFRQFARLAGSSSPNFLQLISNRKLNIQPSGIHALSAAVKLTAKERTYLEYLVAFDHAKTHDEKDRYFRLILNTREYKEIQTLDRRQYELFSHWYIPVIRELATNPASKGDPAWIGGQIVPPVSPAKVKKGIAVLESLGLINRTGDDTWVQTDRVVSTPSEVLSVAVATYHKSVIGLAEEAVERFDSDERDIRAVTLGVSKEGYAEIKKRMETFWKELLAYAGTQKSAERIYQVNMQVFPISRSKGETQ